MIEPTLPAGEIVKRVRRLLHRETANDSLPSRDDRRSADERIYDMRVAHGGLASPPVTSARGGAAGRAGTLAKRLIRKLTAWYVEPRWGAQGSFNEQVISLAIDLEGFYERVGRSESELAFYTDGLREQLDELTARVGELEAHVQRTEAPPAIDYVAFEERFRGASAEVKESQRDYVERFVSASAGGPVVDIGCGRGEMLELLREADIEAIGLDADCGMVEVCRSKGLTVELGDGPEWLRSQPDGSLRGVFLAQVVEHLPTHELVELVALAAAKIGQGGAFIAETIDPRSLYATANYFWADLSHVRPVHPTTLAFLAEEAGFREVGVVQRGRHELTDLHQSTDGPLDEAVTHLLDTVYGYQDYALVANR